MEGDKRRLTLREVNFASPESIQIQICRAQRLSRCLQVFSGCLDVSAELVCLVFSNLVDHSVAICKTHLLRREPLLPLLGARARKLTDEHQQWKRNYKAR